MLTGSSDRIYGQAGSGFYNTDSPQILLDVSRLGDKRRPGSYHQCIIKKTQKQRQSEYYQVMMSTFVDLPKQPQLLSSAYVS